MSFEIHHRTIHIGNLLFTIYPDRNFVNEVCFKILALHGYSLTQIKLDPSHIKNPDDKEKIILGFIARLPSNNFINPHDISDAFVEDFIILYTKLYKYQKGGMNEVHKY